MKELSEHAKAAKAIRADLKIAFPKVKFSVRARAFSMGDAVDIEWAEGPIAEKVQEVVGKYQIGHFDGMDDSYNFSNVHKGLPQVMFVQTHRAR